ncbi:MAG: alpha/beta fold hydrolase, partial [Pseudomonadota bacterium]
MTQLHHETPPVSRVLLALYAAVVEPDQFMRFVKILESALSDESPEALLGALEQPSQAILERLAKETAAETAADDPWLTAKNAAELKATLQQSGLAVFEEDWRYLTSDTTDATIVRLRSNTHATDWTVVTRGPAGFRARKPASDWQNFLRQRFTNQFGLTAAELEVLIIFAQGTDLRTAAAQRGSSYNTVRNQIRSCMEKLSVTSQAALASTVTQVAALAPRAKPVQTHNCSAATQTRQLPDGRRQVFERYGKGKRTLFFFHCLAGGRHLSDEAAGIAMDLGFQVISPSRAGFAGSESAHRQGDELLQTHVADTADLVAATAQDNPVHAVSYGTGFAPALTYALANPNRCRTLIAVNPVPPLRDIGKAGNLKGTFKVGFLAAKYAPASFRALPYFQTRMHRATRATRTAPTVLPDYDLKVLETPSG